MKKLLALLAMVLLLTGLSSSQATVQCHKPKDITVTGKADCKEAVLTIKHDSRYTNYLNVYKDGTFVVQLHRDTKSFTDDNVTEGDSHKYCVEAKGRWGKKTDCVIVEIPRCPPPPRKDCPEITPDVLYFNGYLDQYWYEDDANSRWRYKAILDWGITVKGSRDLSYELLKVVYKIDKDTGKIENAFANQYKLINGGYYDGRIQDHSFEDKNIVKNTYVSYVLIVKCGPCTKWKYFGDKDFWVPRK